MKRISLLAIFTMLLFASCNKWLDVNDNPNSANTKVPTPEQRLPPLIAQFVDSYESAGTRAAFVGQQLAVTYAVNNNWNLTRWYSNTSSANWPWQAWYVNSAVNVAPTIEAAEKVGAYHYMGAAKIIKAFGFAALADFYGMMPYDEFDDPSTITPKFDDAEHIYTQIFALLDEAIADLSKPQEEGAPTLQKGDILMNGNVDNWIKLAYGLKARHLNHLSKLPSYDPQAVLAALALAPQTESQSAIMQYVDETATTTSNSKASLQFQNNSTSRVTKLYLDYITNNYTGAPTGSNDMEDPRKPLLIPRSEEPDGSWRYSKGVDMQSELPKTGPAAFSYVNGKFNHADSIYLPLRETKGTYNGVERVISTGSWYVKKGGKGLLLTNAEMRFIEAEIKFKLNDRAGALAAYKEGIRAHMNILGVPASESSAYLASTSVVQDPSALTLSHIMIQKYIALSFSPEQWADLRRMDFCTDAGGNYNEAQGVYKGFNRPSHVYVEAYPSSTDWPRRFAVPSYEINYNLEEVLKANPEADKPTYLNKPIWWDRR